MLRMTVALNGKLVPSGQTLALFR